VGQLRRIAWTAPARFDLQRLRARTERYSLGKAPAQARRIRNAIESLPDSPRLGRVIQLPDGGAEELRELVVPSHAIRYVVEPQRIVIIRLWPGRGSTRNPDA